VVIGWSLEAAAPRALLDFAGGAQADALRMIAEAVALALLFHAVDEREVAASGAGGAR
jgi:hypothetical protein